MAWRQAIQSLCTEHHVHPLSGIFLETAEIVSGMTRETAQAWLQSAKVFADAAPSNYHRLRKEVATLRTEAPKVTLKRMREALVEAARQPMVAPTEDTASVVKTNKRAAAVAADQKRSSATKRHKPLARASVA